MISFSPLKPERLTFSLLLYAGIYRKVCHRTSNVLLLHVSELLSVEVRAKDDLFNRFPV